MMYTIEKQYVNEDYAVTNTVTLEKEFDTEDYFDFCIWDFVEKDAVNEGYDYDVEKTTLLDEDNTLVITWYKDDNEGYIDYFIRKRK